MAGRCAIARAASTVVALAQERLEPCNFGQGLFLGLALGVGLRACLIQRPLHGALLAQGFLA